MAWHRPFRKTNVHVQPGRVRHTIAAKPWANQPTASPRTAAPTAETSAASTATTALLPLRSDIRDFVTYQDALKLTGLQTEEATDAVPNQPFYLPRRALNDFEKVLLGGIMELTDFQGTDQDYRYYAVTPRMLRQFNYLGLIQPRFVHTNFNFNTDICQPNHVLETATQLHHR